MIGDNAKGRLVDLRSDTVTRPSAGMRRAMMEAPLGDDVFGDDPTVNRLQAHAAQMLGFAHALLFPSGTQSNLAALMSHCGRGDEVIVGQEAHTYRYEAGGGAVLGSIQPQPLANRPDGTLDLAEVEAAIKPDDPHFARTRLLALENTIGGKAIARAYVEQACSLRRRRSLATHLDGARIFNAAADARGERAGPVQRLRLGFGLPVEGPGRAGRHAAAGQRRPHRQGEARAENPRRRDASGRRARGGGPLRARAQRRAPGRGPRQRGASGAGPARRRLRRAGPAHQHGLRQCAGGICRPSW